MANIYKLELTLLEQETLHLLFIKTGEVFTARALALALQVSAPGIAKAIKKLSEKEYILVKKDKANKRLSITLNREDPLIIGLKRANNLKQLYETSFVEELHKKFPGTTVILFGSYAYGEDTTSSDIDIAIIGIKAKEIDFSSFEKKLEREININFYDSFKKIDKHVLNNMLNGIILKGAIEL